MEIGFVGPYTWSVSLPVSSLHRTQLACSGLSPAGTIRLPWRLPYWGKKATNAALGWAVLKCKFCRWRCACVIVEGMTSWSWSLSGKGQVPCSASVCSHYASSLFPCLSQLLGIPGGLSRVVPSRLCLCLVFSSWGSQVSSPAVCCSNTGAHFGFLHPFLIPL